MSTLSALTIQCDALLAMDALEDDSVDLVFTDPPYSSGARRDADRAVRGSMLRGAEWQEGWLAADELSGSGFLSLLRSVAVVSYRVTRIGGFIAVWTDWRQLPQVMAAIETANWRLMNLVVWDKGSFGMGTTFRNQHEMIVIGSKGTANATRHDVGNVLRADRPTNTFHPTPKPVGLMTQVIEVLSPGGGLVVDPFAGSGSTGVAALAAGRRFLGFEISGEFTDLANARLAQGVLPL